MPQLLEQHLAELCGEAWQPPHIGRPRRVKERAKRPLVDGTAGRSSALEALDRLEEVGVQELVHVRLKFVQRWVKRAELATRLLQ